MAPTPRSTVSPTWRADAIAVVIVALVAFVARMAVAATVPDSPPINDMEEYWLRGIYIFEHAHFYDSTWRTPGYPAALALTFALNSGPSLYAARLLNVAMGTATAVLTYWLARRTAAPRPSALAGLAVALYPSLLVYTALVATETPVTVPLLGALIAATWPTRRAAAVSGVFVALTALVRPAGIVLLPALLISCARRPGPSGKGSWCLSHPALLFATFVLTMSPWWIHNATVHKRFIPLDSGLGVNLLIGNGPKSTGQYESGVFGWFLQSAEFGTPEASDRLTAQALAHVREHPVDTLKLLPTKVRTLLAVDGREPGYLYSASYFGPLRGATVWLWGLTILVAFPLLLVAAVSGSSIRNALSPSVFVPGVLFIGATIAMHAITFGESRYHLPMVPVLAVLSTGLAGWRAGIAPWRLGAAALIVACLIGPWAKQLSTSWSLLAKLAAPNGWTTHVAYDDFLEPLP